MRTKLARLKTNAWDTFSKYVRLRDKKCFTCPGLAEQAGHFYHNCLDFDEENIHGQCKRCNHFLSGNLAVYSHNLLQLIGKKKFDALYIRHYQDMKSQKREEKYYEDIIKKYKKKIEKLCTDEKVADNNGSSIIY